MRLIKTFLDPDNSSLWWALGFSIWAAVISVRAILNHALAAALGSIVLLLAAAAIDVFTYWYCERHWPD